MTTDLEKKFFDTFGIEPMLKGYSQVEDDWRGLPMYSGEIKYFNSFEEMNKAGFHSIYDDEENEEYFKEYPQITDRIYLMLLATLTCISSIEFPFSDIQKLKEDILKEVIKHQYGFDIRQVHTLFKE